LTSITVYIVYMYRRCLFDNYSSLHCLYVLTMFIWHLSQFTLFICTDSVYLTSITVYIVYMYWRCLFDIYHSLHCLYVLTVFIWHLSQFTLFICTDVFIWHLSQFTLFICTDSVYLTSITVYIIYMYWQCLFDIYNSLHCLYVLTVFIWHL
jgi:hypothetical protein